MTKVLLIDDDERLAGLLNAYFQRFDLDLVSATLPRQAQLNREQTGVPGPGRD